MFYQCSKCKKTWQYPIEKCPDCFLELARMKSEKIPAPKGTCSPLGKVIGVSKVQISTLLHPKAPYFVLLLEDDNGNKWAQKSIKEYKLGEEFQIELCQDKGAVAIWRIKYDILEGIEKAIELLGGINIKPETKILILPTLISPKHPYLAENTSPQFLESLISYLIGKGVKTENIKIAGQSFTDVPIEVSAQKSQLLKVCQDFKLLPLDLAKTNFVKPPTTNKLVGGEISEEVFWADLVINLPILKIGKAAATENLFKLMKKENYSGLKYLSSDKEIIENLLAFLPGILTIGEAQVVQKPDEFTTFLGLILAGFNPLNLDRIFFELTCKENLPEILKGVKTENIVISGRKVEEVAFSFY